eukprot:GHVP01035843.1.p1 GENE.GHVP01035843.1~~GHVP01035843.1.p1  ORF type:complete len:263 (+),score=49.06 GHVP01035843.1:748-1536(+)
MELAVWSPLEGHLKSTITTILEDSGTFETIKSLCCERLNSVNAKRETLLCQINQLKVRRNNLKAEILECGMSPDAILLEQREINRLESQEKSKWSAGSSKSTRNGSTGSKLATKILRNLKKRNSNHILRDPKSLITPKLANLAWQASNGVNRSMEENVQWISNANQATVMQETMPTNNLEKISSKELQEYQARALMEGEIMQQQAYIFLNNRPNDPPPPPALCLNQRSSLKNPNLNIPTKYNPAVYEKPQLKGDGWISRFWR